MRQSRARQIPSATQTKCYLASAFPVRYISFARRTAVTNLFLLICISLPYRHNTTVSSQTNSFIHLPQADHLLVQASLQKISFHEKLKDLSINL